MIQKCGSKIRYDCWQLIQFRPTNLIYRVHNYLLAVFGIGVFYAVCLQDSTSKALSSGYPANISLTQYQTWALLLLEFILGAYPSFLEGFEPKLSRWKLCYHWATNPGPSSSELTSCVSSEVGHCDSWQCPLVPKSNNACPVYSSGERMASYRTTSKQTSFGNFD